ncbi:DUF6119 family protein [Paenibacillus whitsoniae]|uniref:Sporadically distributed protein, TIGR04141 family n=1 Tax=Paenibacillus whitsoniae TaxID=2496558 RepID=A0A3R9ZZW5_9BACL|nr:DUF6119 family protein [Paenibacillus whitsoniae]RTE02753.1 hypothetical protein EJQ19_28995 [Paenibacillus whitsoniae]
MAAINLYKILANKHNDITDYLRTNYIVIGERQVQVDIGIDSETGEIIQANYQLSLYFGAGTDGKPLSWNWALNLFGHQELSTDGTPKAVIVIQAGENKFAVTFGHSYFRIDQFSDKEWAFEFARRLKYKNVRTTAVTNPNSQRNRTINTYLEYENLDLSSGEALTKLKANIELPVDFELFSDVIEIGNSIRVNSDNLTLEKIVKIVLFIEDIRMNEEVKVKIPFFKIVKEQEEVQVLKGQMLQDFEINNMSIDFSEYQIYATRVVFRDNHEYEYRHKYKQAKCDKVTLETVENFMREHEFSINNDLLDIRVAVFEDGRSIYSTTIEKLIYYTHEQAHALLADGSWYIYNEDYLQYLKDSVAEISAEYEAQYDYSQTAHNEFLEQIFQGERENGEYRDLDDSVIRKKISQKHYKERYYNNWLVDLGFSNFDRELEALGKHRLEVMDLYKENSMFAVKFGKSSGKLCYAVDQSIEAIKAYHRGDIEIEGEIENVYLWLVLERGDLPLIDGQPDINDLNMLILKNKLDQWKKEVRLLGYRPKIKINYARN